MTHKKSIISCALLLTSLVSVTAMAKTTYIPKGYAIETIATPDNVRFHATGLDINAKGDVFVATRFGDVWQYSGNVWSKFADGFHEPTGLLCDDDGSIIVAHKPELTRLVDYDNNGVADEYIRLADGWEFHDNYHEFNFGPVKDAKGNYYGTLNLGHGVPDALALGAMDSGGGYRGWAYKVTPEGKFIPFASGLRSPAGIGISPDDEVFFTDNQGDWVETSKLHLLEQDKFYGHPVPLRDHPDFGLDKVRDNRNNFNMFDKLREKPVVWIPHNEVANSPGNPEWDVTKGKFGPFEDQIFIGDQTQSNIFRVMLDKVNGKYQGAVINFIDGFQSGNIRLKFDPLGQLWVGQTARGWHSKGGKPFGLEKVVWNGDMPFELLDMKLTNTGYRLTFTEPLDPNTVVAEHFKVHEYNYVYTNKYGSDKHNIQTLPVTNVILSPDNKSVDISLALTKGKVVVVEFDDLLNRMKDSPSVTKVYYTLNELL
ncbi:hypothetical protein [Shewanella sp. 10N.286.48.B5]|uniref:DUF7133 domain-containing protein n=1 Tax=Shewanella sp. 10N.286.48.B5 TaxID=1880834 RepID=UPI000C849AC9|nr:hypothetical protein [Shewanella sp. 10N.286.48.B5]PMH84274.1 hypothetical protein BCU57_18275 [Shewanella sp. 10N.286.48.B5]